MTFSKGQLYQLTAVSICLLLIFSSGSAFAFSGGESVTAESPRQSAQAVGTTVSSQIKARTAPSPGAGVGINAGDGVKPYGVWVDVSYNDYKFDGTDSFGGKDHNQTDLWVGMVGIDRTFDKVLVGVALGNEKADTDITTNFYSSNVEGDGYTIAPYVAFSARDWLVLDAMYAYTQTSHDITITGLPMWNSGSYNSTRTSVAFNVNVYQDVKSLLLNPYIGYLYSHNDQDIIDARAPATIPQWAGELTAWFGQWRIGLNATYTFTDKLEGFGGLAYVKENKFGGTNSNQDRDDDEGEGTLGLNYYANDSFAIGASGTTGFGRKDTDTYRFDTNLSYSF